jgi:hypothetical protein
VGNEKGPVRALGSFGHPERAGIFFPPSSGPLPHDGGTPPLVRLYRKRFRCSKVGTGGGGVANRDALRVELCQPKG